MGEIAEMMLEGFLDEETGELIDGKAPGYPRRMSAYDDRQHSRPRDKECPVCKRKFRGAEGLGQHRMAKDH